MTIWWLIVIIGLILFIGVIFIYIILHLKSSPRSEKELNDQTINGSIDNIFNDEFREELRNRGRLHFEKIITENAMFLQQDLQLTTSQLNEYMKIEITQKLQSEFVKYEESLTTAKQLTVEAIQKTNDAIDQQRETLNLEIQKQIETEKKQLLARFENNMASIVNHYVLEAIGNQIDLNDQLEYIVADLEANKQAMIEDINNGS